MHPPTIISAVFFGLVRKISVTVASSKTFEEPVKGRNFPMEILIE